MSYGGYQEYSGNPYGQSEGGYGGSNPYNSTSTPAQGGYEAANPYSGTNNQQLDAPPPLTHGDSNYSQPSQYSQPAHQPQTQATAYPASTNTAPLSQSDFLAQVTNTTKKIDQLSASIQQIATIHQRLLSSPDNSSGQLESIISDTQTRNGQIKEDIKALERDAARDPSNGMKKSRVESLKRTFRERLLDFQKTESDYSQRYREAIARQYLIVNPDATEEEVREASNADWGDEGVFQQALKSNRSGQAQSVLGAVRARHNDIQQIENALGQLALLFQQLDEAVVLQDAPIEQVEKDAGTAKDDTERANKQLTEGVKSARRARKLKWYTLLTVIAIICVLALVLGLYFGLRKDNK